MINRTWVLGHIWLTFFTLALLTVTEWQTKNYVLSSWRQLWFLSCIAYRKKVCGQIPDIRFLDAYNAEITIPLTKTSDQALCFHIFGCRQYELLLQATWWFVWLLNRDTFSCHLSICNSIAKQEANCVSHMVHAHAAKVVSSYDVLTVVWKQST